MASASPASVRFQEDESQWPYSSRPTKRHKRTSGAGASGPSPREIGFMRESQNDGSATFLGSSSGIHFIRHVYNAFTRRSADLDQTRARDRSSVPGEDDRLQQIPGSIQSSDELWAKEELNYAPNASVAFDDLVEWTRSYFENWHPIFPCLHAPTVLKTMETVSQKGIESVNQLELMILRSILSISLGDDRQKTVRSSKINPVPSVLVFRSIQHVMQDVQSLLEKPTSLPLLQAAFTAQLALASLLRLNAASRVGGVITRTAFHLGLHRCPRRFSCFSSEEANIRCRLFWSIYSLERYLSQALGIPLSIRDDDIDVCYPDAERHLSNFKVRDDCRLRLLGHLAKFARIRGLIVELRNKSILHSRVSQIEAAHVTGELAQWWNEVYDDVNPIYEPTETGRDQGPILQPYHRLLLMILRHEATISLNRPLLASENPSADYKNALQTCIGSSRSILAALRKHMSSEPASPLSWPCFTWSAWMACLILMYAAWNEEFPVLTALKYARMGIAILENLSLRGSSWPETCIEAIKGMQSAFKTQTSSGHQPKPTATFHGRGRSSQPNSQATPSTDRRISRMLPAQNENNEISETGLTPIRSQALAPNGCQGRPASTEIRPLQASIRSPAQGLGPAENYDSAVFSPSSNFGNFAEALDPAENYLSGQSSAGLIFGNMADRNSAFNPSFAGQDSLLFSSSMLMNDSWSVADGPWMIHNNF
ncbi:C6 transcription factor, putative [Penicillium digitatum]|uniref:C6 transcription factor, putative n=3 Tax=Penicillium digitatum TaxID=36651 RepID=K9GPC6_PEND2|nr:C6 transcription factor, putative [Penicillium digitatum Pd1]EKV09678.1 C6 transcription factor, putative [Penicillium digitatum Pd1]EKV14986.1 C6 transcription factor, putative [Penicillium digitatum PHI26]QQK44544.1 C6 transcription factor, putative [Penicillium digitatum]